MHVAAAPRRPTVLLRTVAGPIACGCLLAAGAAYVGLNDPMTSSAPMPSCPLYAMTGLYCPGCGLTRAAHALLNGDVVAALHDNAMFPFFFGAIVVAWLAWTRRALGRRVLVHFSRMPHWAPVVLGVVTLTFGVVRNLPGFGALRP